MDGTGRINGGFAGVQSPRTNLVLPHREKGNQAEQIVRRLDENPNDFPKNRSSTITKAIMMPDVYHGHGCLNNSNIS